jgi:hypothetical protein
MCSSTDDSTDGMPNLHKYRLNLYSPRLRDLHFTLPTHTRVRYHHNYVLPFEMPTRCVPYGAGGEVCVPNTGPYYDNGMTSYYAATGGVKFIYSMIASISGLESKRGM